MSTPPITTARFGQALPHLAPQEHATRLLIFGIRHLGAKGLGDAATAHAFFTFFGQGFRRPLMLLRGLMADLSATSAGPIQIAPGCCGRMTAAESALVQVVACVEREPDRARILLSDLLGVRRVDGVLATAQALASAFADAGMPVEV